METTETKLFFSLIDSIKNSSAVEASTHTFAEIAEALKESGHEKLTDKTDSRAFNFARYGGNQTSMTYLSIRSTRFARM